MQGMFISSLFRSSSRALAFGRRFLHHLVLFAGIALLLTIYPQPAYSQTQSPNYWQFPASGRLRHVVAADANHDSVDEFLVVDENGKIDYLNANGTQEWSYEAKGPISAIETANIDGLANPAREIVFGAQDRLTALSVTGEELWRIQVKLAPVPLVGLTSGVDDSEPVTVSQFRAIPIQILPFDRNRDGRDELLVLMESGQLQLYDSDGSLLWEYTRHSDLTSDNQPQMVVGDLDYDGQSEIALASFDPDRRFSRLMLLDPEGRQKWDQEQSVSGRVTALAQVSFPDLRNQYIAVGNNLGQISVFGIERQRLWHRTLNKPVTSLVAANLVTGPGLVAGTSVGSAVAFNGQGQRIWTRYLDPDANRSIVALSAVSFVPNESQPTVSVIIESDESESEASDVVLLANNGRTLGSYPAVDTAGLSRLIDVNRDRNSELLLARFAQVELLGLGLGASETAKGWDYNLFSEPRSVLAVDLEQNGSDELIVGTQDGRIHSLDSNSSIRWLHIPGGAVTHLAMLVSSSEGQPEIAAVRNDSAPGLGNALSYTGWLELRESNGRQVWENQVPARINTLTVGEVNGQGWPEIVVGTASGEIFVFSASGNLLWKAKIGESLEHLLVLEEDDDLGSTIVAATESQVFGLADQNTRWRIATFGQQIIELHESHQPGENPVRMIVVLLEDGTVSGRATTQGFSQPLWELNIGGRPIASIPIMGTLDDRAQQSTADSFLISTDASQLIYLSITDGRPNIGWHLSNLPGTTSLHWTDLDGDALPEAAVGDSAGSVNLYKVHSNRDPDSLVDLDLSSSVFALTALSRPSGQQADLVAITENGLVQLFRAQENLPPLLTNPRVDISQNRYNILVMLQDKEDDDVAVQLELQDPASGTWQARGEKQITSGSGTLFWLVENPPAGTNGVNYRFHYDDGFHQGYVAPPPGPPLPPPPESPRLSLADLGLLSAAIGGLAILLFRQTQLPGSRARRFYRRLKQQPELTLVLLENKYTQTDGSPEFLLYLANQARRQKAPLIAGLADGLFLLADQPSAGLPIILNALNAAAVEGTGWQGTDRWQRIVKVAQALLEAPSVTELALLRPQLAQLLTELDETDHWSPIMDALLPILTNLRDSERMELAEDCIVYLNEAATLLRQLHEHLPEFSIRIEKTLVAAIARRWSALVTAEIEDLRGRAELAITLKTKRLIPKEQTDVVLELRNSGRAAAENLVAELDEDPAYHILSPPQEIKLLPPGKTRQISFRIEPKVHDRFRIALTVTFDDRNRRDKTAVFGDMVHLLPPMREFKPIANPYLPGTPLRRTSPIFYGRHELFSFIAENAGDLAQRNVLILVGERRTGKTSVLLRLEQHLPEKLVPIYIDCQSLGVIPGMPALFHDLAWYVADALSGRNIMVEVPEPAHWQEDPTGQFERRFLPKVRSLLPQGATLLLVFDEFEAFENLVDDGILPTTLFPYLRHLMQHCEGLSFVFVGTRRLEEMSADYWSVLFNIALYRKIGYLSDTSATQLICEPVKPNLVYDDLALDKILRVTTGHPYFLQLVCYTLVKRANAQRNGYATVSDVNAAIDEMLRLGEVHFAYLWQRSTQAERALMTAMAHLMDREAPFHPEDLVQYLRPYGIDLSPAEVTSALGRLVERDILREVAEGTTSRYELRIGLVGLWVARYKSLSMLLTGNGEPMSLATQAA